MKVPSFVTVHCIFVIDVKKFMKFSIFEVFSCQNPELHYLRVPAGFALGFGSGRVLPEGQKWASGRVGFGLVRVGFLGFRVPDQPLVSK